MYHGYSLNSQHNRVTVQRLALLLAFTSSRLIACHLAFLDCLEENEIYFFFCHLNSYESLPPIISRKLVRENVEEATLISCKCSWKVKIGLNSNDGLACFEHGWNCFVKEHGLKIGHFAVFEHVGNLHFKVTVFDSTACEKKFSEGRQNEAAHFGTSDTSLLISSP
ncbi:hypothetical protein ACH5RR_013492 [Cinchona calisaya]|uniref:TF-B3 domain-containing protein n=1 Tax=Cinchona calisaya TaxID=153742 RepID=A0ABD3A3K0_9GENT